MLNFEQTDTVIIPGGSVKRILNSQDVVMWEKYPKSKLKVPFYIENKGTTNGYIAFKGSPSKTVYYSTDNSSWSTITTGDTSYPTLTIAPGKRFYFKAQISSWNGYSIVQESSISDHGKMYLGGNIMSLLYKDDFAEQTSLSNNAFKEIFESWDGLTSAKDLILPATTLSSGCYQGMFAYSSLRVAPSLPATTLAPNCYRGMFMHTKIGKIPELPAATIVSGCYSEMFSGCSGMSEVRCAAKNNTTVSSYLYRWLNGVAASGIFYKMDGTTWFSGDSGIPSGWTIKNL